MSEKKAPIGKPAQVAHAEDRKGQRDPQENVPHMPRHWQEQGTRGQNPSESPPGPDQREVARGNQYGEAGKEASRQVHEELTEHGQEPAPQRRDNKQLDKRPGEGEEALPTPAKADEGKGRPSGGAGRR